MNQAHRSENYTFRPAVAADAEAILPLVKSLGEIEQRPESVTLTEADLVRLIADPASPATVTVVVDGDDIAGYAMTARKFSSFKGFDTVYIEDIVIAPSRKGQGLGTLFMQELARQTLASGAKRLEWSAEIVNGRAIEFYEKLGAIKETGTVHFMMQTDDLAALAKDNESQ